MYKRLKTLHCSEYARVYKFGMDFLAFVYGVKNVAGTEKKMISLLADLELVIDELLPGSDFVMDFRSYVFQYEGNKSKLHAPIKRTQRNYAIGWFMIEESLSRCFDSFKDREEVMQVVKKHAFKISNRDHKTLVLSKMLYGEDDE